MSADPQPQATDRQDAEIAEYRPLSISAVIGLILGMLGPLAVIDPLLWLLPWLGIIFSGLALWQMARHGPALSGRKAACWGLILSLLLGTAVPAHWFGYRWLISRQSRQFAAGWFEFLGSDQPHKAHQMILPPVYRQPLDETLWDFYRGDPRWDGQLRAYVARPLVHALLTLGKNCQVRYYATASINVTGEKDVAFQVYTVTYHDGDEKKTFFVGLKLERVKLDTGGANWRLVRNRDSFLPSDMAAGRRAVDNAKRNNGN